MSTVEISQLCERLSIVDEDEMVHEIAEEDIQDGAEDVDKCLVGRVLSGKKVNRDAFKGLIEQIWSPFGQVEVELVGENTFMFYFINKEDRNRVWLRGPWHFGNSLIVLEKPEGSGNISKLGFNRADIWVQIHDIPIMCMNRRTTRWLAEQIGEVVEIPSESRECWGKYIRVKVKIDITKPLKQWLKLKLGKFEEVTMVGLKYERLSEFCFTCGRIGHGNKECLDEEARKLALEGLPMKFRSWLKATISEKSQYRSNSQTFGSSSERVSPTKKTSKKWKKAAREGQQRQITGKIASPLSRMLNVSKAIRKNSKGSNSSNSTIKGSSLGPPGVMIGLSWNVRGLGNPRTFIALSRLLKTHSPELVFLSKTKLNDRKTDKFRNLLGYSGCFCVDSNGNSGGLMLLWKDSLMVTILSFSSGHIDARICHALFSCKNVISIWYGSYFGNLLDKFKSLPTMDNLQGLADQLSLDDLGLVCMIMWAVWENRNSMLNYGKARDSAQILNFASDLLEEYRNSRLACSTRVPSSLAISSPDWIAPPLDF
ncbi:hypothetical protein EZV62_015628 [Acer yangbiense]|uniref:CCHC-type domain-containing protein n=1 Tax=Acer yangbiense TaxID=1000413 RepID=A0A5C7HLY4_9ROSI|nr:hypothetical protein EZV62_015628 [Acer yangbiense]